jgi:hypothetical protein
MTPQAPEGMTDDYCLYPNQCGPGMDCSACMAPELERRAAIIQSQAAEIAGLRAGANVLSAKAKGVPVVDVEKEREAASAASTRKQCTRAPSPQIQGGGSVAVPPLNYDEFDGTPT